MKTAELIDILSQDQLAKKPPITLGTLGIILVACCGLVTKLCLGLRPELNAMTIPMSFCFKTLVLSFFAVLSLQALKASSVPLGRFTLRHFGIVLAVFFMGSLGYEWATQPIDQIKSLFFLPNFKDCLIYVTLFGSGISVAILTVIKQAAPLHYERTAGLIGLASAAIGALGYSIHCPIDSPTFIIVAYGLPQLALYFVSRLVFPRFLHW